MHFVDAAHLGENDRVAVTGGAATHAIQRALAALVSGATLYPVDMRRASLSVLASLIRDQRITVLQTTPSLLRVLARLDNVREFLGSARLVRAGAEPLLQADLERLRQCLPRECLILVTFGATEASLAQWFVPPDDARDPIRVAAGYPPLWCQIAVLDEIGRPCKAGETGELVLRSRYVALGEWQNGRLVPGRMPPDPQEPSLRIYHTGDLVRQGADGVVVVVGRKDRQLKIRGQRVEPIEVEGVLRRSPDVLEAVALPRQEGEDIRLAAFVVAAVENAKLADSLRAMLETSLPVYMQPSSITLIDTMPLLPGGKIDAHELLARHLPQSPPVPAAQSQDESVPSARAEAMVSRAWQRTLDRVSLSREQRFDDAGGDSLKLLQLVFHLERQCGAMLPLDAFSGSLSPSGFARVLDRIFAARPDPPSAIPLAFLLPGTSKRDPKLDRLQAACTGAVKLVPIDYGDWFEWVRGRFDFHALVARVVAQIETIAPSEPLGLVRK
jgi:acyl carrier protein